MELKKRLIIKRFYYAYQKKKIDNFDKDTAFYIESYKQITKSKPGEEANSESMDLLATLEDKNKIYHEITQMVTDMQQKIDHDTHTTKQLRQQIKETQIDLGITSEHELKARKNAVRESVGETGKKEGQDLTQLLNKQKQLEQEREKQSQKIIQFDSLREWIQRLGTKLLACHSEEWFGNNEMFSENDDLVER